MSHITSNQVVTSSVYFLCDHSASQEMQCASYSLLQPEISARCETWICKPSCKQYNNNNTFRGMKSNKLGMMGDVGPSDSSLWLKTERYRAISHYQTPPVLVSAPKFPNWLTKVLDVFAFLTFVAELEAAGWVAADLSAGHLAIAKRFGDDHVLVHAAICNRMQTHTFGLKI